MTVLPKPLVFYLRHMAEMNRLYGHLEDGAEPDLTGLDDAQHVWEMARAVGATAFEQAADFLEVCATHITAHFVSLGTVNLKKQKKRAYVVRNWEWGTEIHVPSVPYGWFNCGAYLTAPPEVQVTLEDNCCGLVIPWLWA